MTTRKTYIAAKKEILIERISASGEVLSTGWVSVHYQSPLYSLATDKVVS